MKFQFACAASCIAVTLANRSLATPGASEATTPAPNPYDAASSSPALPPGATVTFSIEDADLDELVRSISRFTGKRFIVAAKPKSFHASLVAQKPVTVAEAYSAFLAILRANGLTVLPSGPFLRIVESENIAKQVTPFEGASSEERYVTHLHRVKHVNAEEVATNLLAKFQSQDGSIVPFAASNLLIITDTANNVRRLLRILDEVDVPGEGDKMYFEPVHYADATAVQKQITEILGGGGTGGTGGGNGSGNGSGSGTTAHSGHGITKVIAIDRPNALVIVAKPAGYLAALELLRRIDIHGPSEGQFHVVKLQHAETKKIVGALNELLTGAGGANPSTKEKMMVLEGAVKISAEESTNSILITSSDRDFASMLRMIRELDQPRRQVYIEAVIMDLTVDRLTDTGFSFHAIKPDAKVFDEQTAIFGGSNAAESINPTELQAFALGVRGPTLPGALGLEKIGVSVPAFGAFIHAMAQSSQADILSMPHVTATDNVAAEISVQLNAALQRNAPSFNPANVSAGAAALNPAAAFGAVTPPMGKIGPKIRITPHLNESDEVRLDIKESTSDIVEVDKAGLGTVSYLERAAETTVTVKDQETIVIGGLVRTKQSLAETKVPILGDIPILGMLFRSSKTENTKSNLVLVLTPYIIRNQDDMRRIYERKMQERQELLDRSALFRNPAYEAPRDYARTNGVLEDIRQSARGIDEAKKLEAMAAPRQAVVHDATEPIELPLAPTNLHGGGSTKTDTKMPEPTRPTPKIRVE